VSTDPRQPVPEAKPQDLAEMDELIEELRAAAFEGTGANPEDEL
jgi:hypothetical protein